MGRGINRRRGLVVAGIPGRGPGLGPVRVPGIGFIDFLNCLLWLMIALIFRGNLNLKIYNQNGLCYRRLESHLPGL